VVVRDFNVVSVARAPGKTNPPLIVNPNAVLPLAVSAEPFQEVTGQRRQDSQIVGRIEHIELPKSLALDSAELPAGLAMKEPLSLVAPEGLDHLSSL
jgi:hypothetical protein